MTDERPLCEPSFIKWCELWSNDKVVSSEVLNLKRFLDPKSFEYVIVICYPNDLS